MKKTILAVVLVLSTLCSLAQNFTVNVFQVDILSYNTLKDEYEMYRTFYPSGMEVKKIGEMFVVTNEDRSRYTIDKELTSEDPTCVNFTAYDKDNELIGLQFCLDQKNTKGTMTALYLKKMAVVYHVKP